MLISLRDSYETFPSKDRISYKEYEEIVKSICKKIRDLVISGRKVSTGIGAFSIKKKRAFQGKSKINIVESMRYKKEIIARGDTPYESYKDKDGNIIGNNGGENYLVHYTDDFFYMTTLTTGAGERCLKENNNNYVFKPAASTERLRRSKLKGNTLIKLRYAEN